MKQNVSEMIDNDYRLYSMYTIENRAIPSVIDGFKPVQRKVFYAMNTKFNGKKTKVNDLGSISDLGYHHGESSAQGAAVGMAQAWSNNIPEFIGHGTFGTRLVPEAAAPRYIYASSNQLLQHIFLDEEILDKNPDPEQKDPLFFLPIIPWVLVNGSRGMAVGFANLILPRDPKELCKDVRSVLGGLKDVGYTLPSFPKFKGSVELLEAPAKVLVRGVVENGKKNTLVIKEAPFNESRESMHEWLEKLEEKGKIEDFSDNSDKDGFSIEVKLNTEQMQKASKDPVDYLGLTKIINENFTTLDESGKIKVFATYNDLVQYFVQFRLAKTEQALNFHIARLQDEETRLAVKAEFIFMMIQVLQAKFPTDADLENCKVKACQAFNVDVSYADGCERLAISSFTVEKAKELENEKQKRRVQHQKLSKIDHVKYYLDRITELEKQL